MYVRESEEFRVSEPHARPPRPLLAGFDPARFSSARSLARSLLPSIDVGGGWFVA